MAMENGKNMGAKFFRTKAFFWDTLVYIDFIWLDLFINLTHPSLEYMHRHSVKVEVYTN